MDENTIVVTDELGNEVEYEILFTFENEENGHQYVVYFDPEKDEGGLFPIETPEEWELVEEVFQSFVSEEDEDETEYCEGEDEDETEYCEGEDEDCNS